MEEVDIKLKKLYEKCILELKVLGLDFVDRQECGNITISTSKRMTGVYGRCKHTNPDLSTRYKEKGKIKVSKYNDHEITISKWVMELNEDIICNTIIHELIHCLPGCNNHGENFKKIAKYISSRTDYEIQRTGNAQEDHIKSNKDYEKPKRKIQEYKYKVICQKCNQEFLRKRIDKAKFKKYRCAYCLGKFTIKEL